MSPAPDVFRVGCGAGFSGDRVDAALPVVRTLIARGGPACLMFETLAERTLAQAQLRRRESPEAGYEPRLTEFLAPVLSLCLAHGITIIGNFGAANPPAAARRIRALAREQGLADPRIAVIEGDDWSGADHRALLASALNEPAVIGHLVSANVYLGAQRISEAIRAGAQIVVAGRVADSALALGPLAAHFGWSYQDWDRLARGTMVGHLLECGAQVTGGYFADPGFKDVQGLATVGFPIAEVDARGDCVVTKADDTGGLVDRCTVIEQLLYEINDPAGYLTPDVIADLSAARVENVGVNRVAVRGVVGKARPATLKVSVCYEGGWLAEGEISYAGPGAEQRARLAARVLAERMPGRSIRFDLIGCVSLHADDAGRMLAAAPAGDRTDVRLRAALATDDRAAADRLVHEVDSLYTCGPAGGGGVRAGVRPRLRSTSCLVPREAVAPHWHWAEGGVR